MPDGLHTPTRRHHTPTRRRQTRARALGLALLVSGALVSGCGGGSSGPTVARLGGASTPAASAATGGGEAGSAPSSSASLDAAALAFSKCMRANGMPNFPDPSPSGGFLFHAGSGPNPSSPAMRAAQAKCRKLLPGGGPPGPGSSTSPSAGTLARFLKIARCMREHGVSQFPDPRTSVPSNAFGSGGSAVISDIEGVILIFPSAIDQQSPLFVRAAAVCAFPLHNH